MFDILQSHIIQTLSDYAQTYKFKPEKTHTPVFFILYLKD